MSITSLFIDEWFGEIPAWCAVPGVGEFIERIDVLVFGSVALPCLI